MKDVRWSRGVRQLERVLQVCVVLVRMRLSTICLGPDCGMHVQLFCMLAL